jgi:hypothetical protein
MSLLNEYVFALEIAEFMQTAAERVNSGRNY